MGRHSATGAVLDSGPEPVANFPAPVGRPHRHHRALWITTAGFWILALAAGFVATLGMAARFGCVSSAKGLGCTNGGSVLSALLIFADIVTVGVCTVFAFEARDEVRRWARYFGVGIGLLILIVVAARLLSSTL